MAVLVRYLEPQGYTVGVNTTIRPMAFDLATFNVVYDATYGVICTRTHGFNDLDDIDGSFVAEVYEEVFVGREVTDPGTLLDPMDILETVYDDVADEAKNNIHSALADIASEASAWGDDWEWED